MTERRATTNQESGSEQRSSITSAEQEGSGERRLARARAANQGLDLGLARSPFAVMRRMMEDMDRAFEDFGWGGMLSPFSRGLGSGQGSALGEQLWAPQVEVEQREGKLLVKADLPGLSQEDIDIELQDGALLLRGERRREDQGEREGVRYSERTYGSFTRSIPVPRGVQAEDVDARFNNGVLEMSLKLPEQARSRTVQIKSSSEPSSDSSGQGSSSRSGSA